MSKLNRKKVILAKVQADPTTAEVLTESDGGILIKEATSAELDVLSNDRSDVARCTLSQLSNVTGSKAMSITIEGELIGAGEGNTPTIDAILRICGMENKSVTRLNYSDPDTPFINGDILTGGTSGATAMVIRTGATLLYAVDVVGSFTASEVITGSESGSTGTLDSIIPNGGEAYVPRSSGLEKGTVSLWEDGYQRTIKNAVGTISFATESSLVGSFTATISGVVTYDDTTNQWGDGTQPCPTFSELLPSVLHDATLTVTDPSDGSAVTDIIGTTVAFDLVNTVSPQRDMNQQSGLNGYNITARVPTCVMGIEYLTDTQYPIYERMFNDEEAHISMRLGTTSGQLILFDGKLNYTSVTVGEENGLLTQEINTVLVDNGTGDGEFSIIYR